MKLILVEKLTEVEREKLAAASLKARPATRQREEFAALRKMLNARQGTIKKEFFK